jgi:hypothetical protein
MTPVVYVWISGHPKGILSLFFSFLGTVAFIFVFHVLHRKRAEAKKAEFVAAGGDPSGITQWMFGAMPGRTLPDGTWAWTSISDRYTDCS